MSMMSSWSNVSFKAVISLLIFCLDDLCISDSGVFRFPTTIVFLLLFLLVIALHILGLPDW